jgi:(1->4)-alpha-D-glucan 1-alpha-D-glucosylmutase
LQFNSHFTFADARGIVDYLATLGVTDCYASSYLAAVPGSPHGYDVTDPTRLNPEIGTPEEYWAWIGALRSRSMGHVLDLVPNHMGIARSANPWWLDVLENGPSSRYARFFDIEWRPVKRELADKVLIPILGDQYGAVLERKELQLAYRQGAFVVKYLDDVLPIAPDTFAEVLLPGLEEWMEDVDEGEVTELRSIITASTHLPPRSTRDPDQIAVRAREKEVVKRRLAALVEASRDVRALIAANVRRINGTPRHPRSFDHLDQLLNQQSYRLAHWRVASEEINYRRFFDVNQLAALRMEDAEVFEEIHRFAFELIQQRAATGVRVDHVDGLYAPADYLRRLQYRAGGVLESADDRPLFIVVEKILGPDETLPADWPVHGTTGYEFSAAVNALFVDPRNERAMDDIYARFIRRRLSFTETAYQSKKQIFHETMSGDINSLGHQLNLFAERNRHFRDFTLYSLISTLKQVIACFPVYRTYVTADQPVDEHDRRYIAEAIRCARHRSPAITGVVLDFIERLLLKETPATSPTDCVDQARFIGKFQQITSPIAAKGIEDTAFYVYNRLLSLNEVGGNPMRFGIDPADLHAWMTERQRRWPAALSTTATHDTKRGEDARARLNVLSEIPGAWKAAVTRWRTINRRHKSEVGGKLAPDSNEEYLLYQTLIGAWPFAGELGPFRDRLRQFMIKALREAKVHTNWLSPDEEYERAVLRFIDALLDCRRPNTFLPLFQPFQRRVAELGMWNSLSQLLIKITAPGVPDFYQGTELWDLSLVDPDNRQPVDYDLLRRILDQMNGTESVDDLLDHRHDGRVKLFAMSRALDVRARSRDVFEHGDYIPLATTGTRRDCLFAFARRDGDRISVTCVPRLVASLNPNAASPPLGAAVWADTAVELPPDFPRQYRDGFTGVAIDAVAADGAQRGAVLPAASLFERFPIALLMLRMPRPS